MSARAKTQADQEEALDFVREQVKARLSSGRDVTLAKLATRVGYSERQLQRLLRPYGGFRVLRREARMAAASEMLLRGQRVRDVAPKVGYSPKHFSDPFEVCIGVRPQQVRAIGRDLIALRRYASGTRRGANLVALCRTVDRWDRVWRRAARALFEVKADSAVAAEIASVLRHSVPIPRPLPRPVGRQRATQEAWNRAVGVDLETQLRAATSASPMTTRRRFPRIPDRSLG